MAEEKVEVKEFDFSEFRKTKEYVDYENTLKGSWLEKSKTNWLEEYNTNTLPGIKKKVKDDVILELQPEETELEKRLKALEKSNSEKDLQIALTGKKELLRIKAKELGSDISRADRYSVYGDDAEKYLEEDFNYMTETINTAIDEKIKGSYTKNEPKANENKKDDFDLRTAMSDITSKL